MIIRSWERWTLALILTGVGLLAARVSVGHVATFTMENSPPGTSPIAGWTNAAISELLPVAGLIAYRVQRRHGSKARLAAVLVVAAGLFSLGAQLAVAKASPSGWVVSAVPMLAFMALTKLVIGLLSTGAAQPSGQAVPPQSTGMTPKPTIVAAQTSKPTPQRSRQPSLTTAGKVAAAVERLGADAPVADIASAAGVSVSSVGRHLPKPRQANAKSTAAETVAPATPRAASREPAMAHNGSPIAVGAGR